MARRVAIVEMPCKLTHIFLKCRMYRRIFVVLWRILLDKKKGEHLSMNG